MRYDLRYVENARLVILRYLYEDREHGGSASDTLIWHELEAWGVRRSRDFCRTQILALRDLGGVTVVEAGTALIATITNLGVDHVERRQTIAGVLRPSQAE